ncbi:hypothetical protein BF49_1017 [Bradyrhizobium sp.]|nr:hypothetical protein BF49_1017 [Bradyrhizobium sp.]
MVNALIGLALPCHRHIVRVPRRHVGTGFLTRTLWRAHPDGHGISISV